MTAFAWLAAALFAAYLALLAALHVTDRSRNVWRDPVSDYAVGASRPLGLAMGAAGTGGVLALAAAFALAGLPTWLWLCTAGAGVARGSLARPAPITRKSQSSVFMGKT